MDLIRWQRRFDGRFESHFGPIMIPTPLPPCEQYLSSAYFYSHESDRYLSHVRGPLGIYGVSTPHRDYHFSEYASRTRTVQRHLNSPWPYPPTPPTTPPPRALLKPNPESKAPPKNQDKPDDDTDSLCSSIASWKVVSGLPALPSGTNYMFPSEHTTIHVLRHPISIWKEKYRGQKFPFMIHKVSTQMTVTSVIENVMKVRVGQDFDQCKGWAVTEVIEQGDGKWAKGTTVVYDSSKAGSSLSSMGWNAKRGELLPPVWLTVHKVEADAKED